MIIYRAGKYVITTIGALVFVVAIWPFLWLIREDVRVRSDLIVDGCEDDNDPGIDIDEEERLG